MDDKIKPLSEEHFDYVMAHGRNPAGIEIDLDGITGFEVPNRCCVEDTDDTVEKNS